jgi:hypothetical protein
MCCILDTKTGSGTTASPHYPSASEVPDYSPNPRLRKFGPKVRLSAKVAAFGKPSKVSGFESAWTAPRVDRELQKQAMKEFSELASSISIMRPTKDGKS